MSATWRCQTCCNGRCKQFRLVPSQNRTRFKQVLGPELIRGCLQDGLNRIVTTTTDSVLRDTNPFFGYVVSKAR